MKTISDPLRVGNTVVLLTRGYHWIGRVGALTGMRVVLEPGATFFANIGQIDQAVKGEPKEAYGRQVSGAVSLPVHGVEAIDYQGAELPQVAYDG